ncbi:MAG: hypothetical protein HY917_01875 [Candidatus Diapherotrites archaeon]|nr:hypothetical protein [Candidatus Diapherotrites archaeon]
MAVLSASIEILLILGVLVWAFGWEQKNLGKSKLLVLFGLTIAYFLVQDITDFIWLGLIAILLTMLPLETLFKFSAPAAASAHESGEHKAPAEDHGHEAHSGHEEHGGGHGHH